LIEADVERAIASAFAEPARADVRAALALYLGPEVTRVRLAILVLADGNTERVRQLVDEDYRDVLCAAEYPEQASGGRQTRAAMADRYRRLGVPVPESLR
jgi:hypothetical protein